MTIRNCLDELALLLKASYKLIHFCTQEELRAERELVSVAKGRNGGRERECFVWKETTGMVNANGKDLPDAKGTDTPIKALQWISDRESKRCKPALYIFKDLHPYLGTSVPVRLLRDVTQLLSDGSFSAIILLSGRQLKIPDELEKEIVIVDFALPTKDELKAKYVEIINENRSQIKNLILTDTARKTEDDGIAEFAKAAQGLTMSEAVLALGKAFTEKGELTLSHVAAVAKEKEQIIRKTGILTLEQPGKREGVGGLEQLWEWLGRREGIFKEDALRFGLTPSKGVLLTGVPGCGKTLCARAMASFWEIPLLRLDMGAIYGKYVGESEKNLRKAMDCA